MVSARDRVLVSFAFFPLQECLIGGRAGGGASAGCSAREEDGNWAVGIMFPCVAVYLPWVVSYVGHAFL